MAVSKRTRYEVLRRDNHTCRYCGLSAPAAALTVDHVTPTALGGTDNPDNLVAACRDCNAGKASTSPDAAMVADVKALDLKWSGAIKRVASARSRQRKRRNDYVDMFVLKWGDWTWGDGKPIPRPAGWQASIERFYELGVPIDELTDCVRIACGNDRIHVDETFRYFAGCVWRVVKDMQEAAKELLDAEEVSRVARDHARIQTAIHNDPEWRRLDWSAQHIYWMLTTHPDVSYCGHIDYIPGRWLDFAAGLTEAKIKTAVRQLERARYLVVDRKTHELLIRSFIRHDKLLARRNMGHACGRALGMVHSDVIREAVLHELARLHLEDSKRDGWAGFKDYDPEAYAMACRMASDMASDMACELDGSVA